MQIEEKNKIKNIEFCSFQNSIPQNQKLKLSKLSRNFEEKNSVYLNKKGLSPTIKNFLNNRLQKNFTFEEKRNICYERQLKYKKLK